MNIPRTTPAQSISEVYLTLRPEPLTTKAELAAFYRNEVNDVRGGDKVQRLAQGLKRAHGSGHFKALFMGHQGSGKSTELSRLSFQMDNQFRVIRFSAANNIDPNNFNPLDIILTMMIDVAERTSQPIDKGGLGMTLPNARLQEIWDWFATEKDTREQTSLTELDVVGGAGVREDSLWGKVLGLFVNLKGEMKFAVKRKKEIIEYRISRLPDLIKIANRLLDDCNELLRQKTGQEWLFIGEDFDKPGIPNPFIENLFINNANIFRELRVHMIFTLPISLYYSSKSPQLPFDLHFVLPDTPMFSQNHLPNTDGQKAVANVLMARMLPGLFEAN
jgi:hypothetical protein